MVMLILLQIVYMFSFHDFIVYVQTISFQS